MPTKLVHLFDENRIYTGDYQAQSSPLEPDVFIEPVNSTALPLPALAENQTAQFISGAWVVVPDFRGATWYDQATGAPVDIIAAGQPAANLAVTAPPPPTPPAPTLAQTQIVQIQLIKNATESALQAIVAAYPSLEVATWPNQYAEASAYTANSAAQTPTLSAIAAASGQPVAALAASVLTKAAAYTAASGAVVGKRQALTAQINAATTVVDAQAVVW